MNEVSEKLQSEKEIYVAPDIQLIEVDVEKGFAQSPGDGGPGGGDEPEEF